MCDTCVIQSKDGYWSHVMDHETRRCAFKQNVQCVFKRGNPHLHLGANHCPLRADQRLLGSHKHTDVWEGDCGTLQGATEGGVMASHEHLDPMCVITNRIHRHG